MASQVVRREKRNKPGPRSLGFFVGRPFWAAFCVLEAAMSHFLSFYAPVTPYGKGRARFHFANGSVRVYTPAKTRKFETIFSDFAHGAMMNANLMPTYDAVRVRLIAHFPVPKSYTKKKRAQCLAGLIHPTAKPDIDNVLKSALDALNGVVFADDKQVFEVIIKKAYTDRDEGYYDVEIEVE